jgi:hypothetical protein
VRLIVHNLDTERSQEITDPEMIALASEGWCPYRNHWNRIELWKLTAHPDGTVTCNSPAIKGEEPDGFGVTMRLEFIDGT